MALPGFLPRTVQCVAKIVNICYPHFGAKTARSLDVEREPSVVHTASQWPLGPGPVDERHAQPCWPGGGCTPRHGPIRHSHAHTHTHTCIAHIAPCLSRESPRNPVAVQHAAAFIIPQAVLPVASPSRDFYVEWALRCSLTCCASVCVCVYTTIVLGTAATKKNTTWLLTRATSVVSLVGFYFVLPLQPKNPSLAGCVCVWVYALHLVCTFCRVLVDMVGFFFLSVFLFGGSQLEAE